MNMYNALSIFFNRRKRVRDTGGEKEKKGVRRRAGVKRGVRVKKERGMDIPGSEKHR